MGLHQRYGEILRGVDVPDTMALMGDKEWQEIKSKLSAKFDKMMKALFRQKGAQLDIGILATDEAQDFINTHAGILDSSFEQVEMTPGMRERLTRSDYIFSGMKAFHELNEAFPSMLDEDGRQKPFERFLNDVRKIDETYNAHYLHAEYNFVSASAEMAAKWERYAEDGDRYYLQYRTAHDDKVRPEHAALDGVTLPMSDTFWETYYPPNGWNCRCSVAQVRKQKYEATPHEEAMRRGEEALSGEKYNIFRFNSGKQGKAMPDYNPYTIKRCNDCDIAKGGLKLAKYIPENDVCAACKFMHTCEHNKYSQNFRNYRAEATKEATKWDGKYDNLQTGKYYQTKKSFKRAIGHARSVEQMELYSNIKEYVPKLKFVKKSPLGEVKDQTDPKDVANLNKKKERHVTGYNVYELEYGGIIWIIKTEVFRNTIETVYCLYPKEK